MRNCKSMDRKKDGMMIKNKFPNGIVEEILII